jgi:peptidoglycan/xylan/chitin deacetylase (PgdA/CDA1 family)
VRLCSVSIDLDELTCYSAVHGLAPLVESHAVYDVALPRILDFATSLSAPLTLFVIARDLDRVPNQALLKRAVAAGHEIGNHSLDHLYDLTRREPRVQLRQIAEANSRIRALLGVQPQGFRAPGYTMNDGLIAELHEAGLDYDSSVFPCPAYYAAKAATLLTKKLRRRRSASIVDVPQVLLAPTHPYRAGKRYWTRGNGMLELPIQVVGPLRLPFIGTSLTLLGPRGAHLLTRALTGVPFVNLELHGIDFLEAHEAPRALRAVQPDLRVPLVRKLQVFETVLNTLRAQRYSVVRLDEAARIFGRS